MIKRMTIFIRNDNRRSVAWKKKIEQYIAEKYPEIILSTNKPQVVIALGGDGTILEASRTFRKHAPITLGLNLGHVGFLASVRQSSQFLKAIDALLAGEHRETKRMMITARVYRKKKLIHECDCLNEVTAQGLMIAAKMTVSVDGYPLQNIHGTGVIISTPTGSTAYNLSSHGPIVTPDIHCMIITELLDHNIPTPSIVVKRTKTIHVDITEVRKRGVLSLTATNTPIDAVLTVDDMDLFPLEAGDRIEVVNSEHFVRFAEFEDNYFLKSIQKKFAFR